MKDQREKAALKRALIERVAEAFPGDFEAQALEIAALTLALEAGARQGRSEEDLSLILQEAAHQRGEAPWVMAHLELARKAVADPTKAEGVWKEALSVIQPLGMDLS